MSLKELEVVVAKLEGTRDPQGRGKEGRVRMTKLRKETTDWNIGRAG